MTANHLAVTVEQAYQRMCRHARDNNASLRQGARCDRCRRASGLTSQALGRAYAAMVIDTGTAVGM